MQTTSYTWIERSVCNRLNLLAGETAVATDNLFRKTEPLTPADLATAENRWALSAIRSQIVDVVIDIAQQVCLSEGDPRRRQYRKVADVEHGALLPSSIGGYGSFTALLTPDDETSRVSLQARAIEHIQQVRMHPETFGFGAKILAYATDGNTLYSTLSPVTVEHFDFERPAQDPAEVDALFENWTTIAPIDDELIEAAASGATGLLALNADSLKEAGEYLQIYINEMQMRGLKPIITDLPAKPKA